MGVIITHLLVKETMIHSEYSHSWDYSRSARALSECPLTTTSDVWAPVSNLYYVPTALREARGRSMSPFEWVSSQSPITRVEFPSYPPAEQRSTTISYGGNSPWNSTGFYYSPRYPQAYRHSCHNNALCPKVSIEAICSFICANQIRQKIHVNNRWRIYSQAGKAPTHDH